VFSSPLLLLGLRSLETVQRHLAIKWPRFEIALHFVMSTASKAGRWPVGVVACAPSRSRWSSKGVSSSSRKLLRATCREDCSTAPTCATPILTAADLRGRLLVDASPACRPKGIAA